MLIGEVCKQTKLSRDTIRFYEKKGLITAAVPVSKFNNYKNYTIENVEQLQVIKKAKKFGFTLNEIADLLELVANDKANCKTLGTKLKNKLEDIDQKITALQEMKEMILKRIEEAVTVCSSKQNDQNCKSIK